MQVAEGAMAEHQDPPLDMGSPITQHDTEPIDAKGMVSRFDRLCCE